MDESSKKYVLTCKLNLGTEKTQEGREKERDRKRESEGEQEQERTQAPLTGSLRLSTAGQAQQLGINNAFQVSHLGGSDSVSYLYHHLLPGVHLPGCALAKICHWE